MNVLFYRYGSICEPDILEIFEHMQFCVFEETQEITKKALPLSAKLSAVSDILCEHNVDFVFSINFPFSLRFMSAIKYIVSVLECGLPRAGIIFKLRKKQLQPHFFI